MEPLEFVSHKTTFPLLAVESPQNELRTLVKAMRKIADRGYCPATSGNFSVRSAQGFLVTASGISKGEVTGDDFLEIINSKSSSQRKASAETALHDWLYVRFAKAMCVLHTHSMAATVLSSWIRQRALFISDLELLKALDGYDTHLATLRIPIVTNSQNMDDICLELDEIHAAGQLQNCFLIRGHGLYTWGDSVKEAERHLECLEFLLASYLELSKLENAYRFFS